MTNRDTDRLRRRLLALPREAERQMREALRKSADEIVATQKRFAPVKSGKLRESIRHTSVGEDEGRIAVAIKAGGALTTKPVRNGQSATYDYALGEEFGTEDAPAHPFFYPGYRANKKRAKSRTSRAIKKAARDAVKK